MTNKLEKESQESLDKYSIINTKIPEIETIQIKEEDTLIYQLKEQTEQIIQKTNEQIRLLNEHNEQLANNYKKLEQIYSIKESELEESKKEVKKSKRYNIIMMIIAILSLLYNIFFS